MLIVGVFTASKYSDDDHGWGSTHCSCNTVQVFDYGCHFVSVCNELKDCQESSHDKRHRKSATEGMVGLDSCYSCADCG